MVISPSSFLCKKDKLPFDGSYWWWLKVRSIDMGTSKWSDVIFESLSVLHVILGWDFVSAVNGQGRAKWLNTAQKKEKHLQSVSQLGDTVKNNADVFQKCI